MSTRLAVATALALALPSLVRSQEPAHEPRISLALKAGAVRPKRLTNGLALEAAFGIRVHRYLALEFGAGRFTMNGTHPGTGPFVYTATENVVAYPVLASVKLVAPLGRVELFGVLGGGSYILSSTITGTQHGGQKTTANDSAIATAFHVGGGVAVRVAPTVKLGAELKYVDGTSRLWERPPTATYPLPFDGGNFDSLVLEAAISFLF